ncbi:MAG: MFS transporter, partial [Acidimicrobiales bacterium]
ATRSSANVARALLYAGMYGMFFFLSQFFQDVQGYSPLLAGVAFLPMPASVFLSSQFASRVLVPRLPQKAVMAMGAVAVTLGLASAVGTQATTPYGRLVVSMVLIGCGMGAAFVSLTSASLAEVAPEDAGAASGLVNVSQQLGGAVGLAVLVTAFDSVTHHVRLGAPDLAPAAAAHADAVATHGLDVVFGIGAALALAALALMVVGVRTPRPEPEPVVVPLDLGEEAVGALERDAG